MAQVMPVDVNEATSSVDFELPHLPISSDDLVRVAFSVNGQQFVDATSASGASDDAVSAPGGACFRYVTPAATASDDQPSTE